MDQQGKLVLSLVQGGDGKAWATQRNGWRRSETNTVCFWEGVGCDPLDKVVSIDIPGTDLSATIPPELGELTSLHTLVLSENEIRGRIPHEVADLPNLELFNVADNLLSGSVPLFASQYLRTVDLSSNRLTGSLPEDFGVGHTLLTSYDVMKNTLTGTIPPSVLEMTNLQTLSLTDNSFSGILPSGLGTLQYLKFLYLDNNYFIGAIPADLARVDVKNVNGGVLEELWLQENMLSGTVPAALADASKLVDLFLDGNKLTGKVPKDLCRPEINSDFFAYVPYSRDRNYCDSIACPVGTVAYEGVYPCKPCETSLSNPYIGRAGKCVDLKQRDILNKLYETTSQRGQWKGDVNWNDDELSVCEFTGVTCDNNDHVISIELRDRGLTGTIPDEIGFLEYLQVLDLADNKLQGFVPSDLRWAPLKSLDISGNKIRGVIPPTLCLKEGINGNGENGDYNCQRLACPVGTYSPTGREGEDHSMCKPCADGSIFLGQKECIAMTMVQGVHPQHDDGIGVAGIVGITLGLVVVGIVVSFFIATRLRRTRGQAVSTSEFGEDAGLRPNTVGESSLPGSENGNNWSMQANEEGLQRNAAGVSSLPGVDDASRWSILPKRKSAEGKLQPNTVGESSLPESAEDIRFPIPAKGRSSSSQSHQSSTYSIKVGTFPTDESFRNLNSSIKGVSEAEAAALANAVASFGGDNNEDESLASPQLSQRKGVNGNDGNEKKRRVSKSSIWDYPDPLEKSSGNGLRDDWNSSNDSNKEVWLDVPKI